MKIPVTCAGCGKRHEVDAAHAGKRGKCTKCGSLMLVPTAPAAPPFDDDDNGEAYGLDEPISPPPRAAHFSPARPDAHAPSTFTRTGSGDSTHAKSTGPRKRREEQGPDFPWRPLAIGVAVASVVLFLVALLVPGGAHIAGFAIVAVGLLLSLVGYAMGAYGAFREDSLYGFLYLLIPLYTAYYLVTRFDDLWRWLALSILGLVLVSLGGLLLEVPLQP